MGFCVICTSSASFSDEDYQEHQLFPDLNSLEPQTFDFACVSLILGFKMSAGSSFNFCRVCLAPPSVAQLTSLFDNDGENAEKLRKLSEVDVSLRLLFFVVFDGILLRFGMNTDCLRL
jgi:hypothetical protein